MVTAASQTTCCTPRSQASKRRRQRQRAAAHQKLLCQLDAATDMQVAMPEKETAVVDLPQERDDVHNASETQCQFTMPDTDRALVDVAEEKEDVQSDERSTQLNESEDDMRQEEIAGRCVKFDDSMCEVFEIMPYSEIYGIHPRDFVFDKYYYMLPADGVTDMGAAWKRRNLTEEDDSEGLSDEDLLTDDWEYEYTM